MESIMFRRTLSAVVLSLGFVVFAQPNAPQAKLLCVSNRTGDADIFLINADGSDAVNLTKNKAEDLYPAWSPDGKKIAFSSDRDGRSQLYVMDADGGNVKRLAESDDIDRAPAWSPDGKTIIFCRHLGGDPEIFIVSADGAEPKNLTSNNAYDADPAWSPDGKKIVFASNRDGGGFHLYTMDPDGDNVQRLTDQPNPFGYVSPAWSPDGKHIAYTDVAQASAEIFLHDHAAGKRTQLTKLDSVNTQAAWSPDGKRLAVIHIDATDFMDKVGSLHVIGADGMNAKQVLKREVPLEGGRPAWKPRDSKPK
jgi:TolB protein